MYPVGAGDFKNLRAIKWWIKVANVGIAVVLSALFLAGCVGGVLLLDLVLNCWR